MTVYTIPISPQTPYKIMIFNATVGKEIKRFRMELRHLNYTDKWYISIFDAQSGASYCRYVPIVTSKDALNNLIELFSYENIGWMGCIARISEPSSVDPKGDNIDQFEIVWGDNFEL